MERREALSGERILARLDEFFAKNDYIGAKEHLHFWLSQAEEANDRRVLLLLCNELMGFYRKQGEHDLALSFARRAVALIEDMGIETNVGAATTYLNCATVYKAFSMSEGAIELFEKAKEIYEKELPPYDTRRSGLYNNMALALVDLRRFDEADELYKKALAILKATDSDRPEQAVTYLNMASAAEAQYGLLDAAERIAELADRAQEMLDSSVGQSDGNYAFVCEKCAPVFGYYGYFGYESELRERARRIYEGD